MPTADPLTPIRAALDLDLDDEAAWTYAAQYVPTPSLVFAAREYYKAKHTPNHTDWYTLKAIRADALSR